MPDRNPVHRPPGDWADAFAALPAETPPPELAARVLAALERGGHARVRTPHPPRPRRTTHLRWALAATLAVLSAGAAWQFALRTPHDAPALAGGMPGAAAAKSAVPARSTADLEPPQRLTTDAQAPTRQRPPSTLPADHAPSRAVASAPAPAEETASAATSQRRPRPAGTTAAPAGRAVAATVSPAAASVTQDDALLRLQRESAQLETLVAMARDDRVSSAAATVMSSQLEGHIALIDLALADGSLPEAQRRQLWQQRVEALRELAGLESTQRWLAANGEAYDGALVALD